MSVKPYTREIYKPGKRVYGETRTMTASGRRCYIAYRRQKEIFRSGEATMTAAVQKKTACWAIDERTLLEMRVKGIKIIVIWVRETGDLYGIQIEHFFDRTKTKLLNYESRGGALQRYMPIDLFRYRQGKTKKL